MPGDAREPMLVALLDVDEPPSIAWKLLTAPAERMEWLVDRLAVVPLQGSIENAEALQRVARRSQLRTTALGWLGRVASDHAICLVTGAEPDRRYAVFDRVELGGSPEYVHLTGARTPPAVDDSTHLHLVTGCCLYGPQAARCMFADGTQATLVRALENLDRPIERLHVNEDALSLYELDATNHLADATAGIAASAGAGRVTVTLDVPRVQYYLTLLDPYNAGLLDGRLMLEWLDRVDARHRRLVLHLRSRLEDRLASLAASAPVEILVSEGLDVLEPVIRVRVEHGLPVPLDALLQVLVRAASQPLRRVVAGKGAGSMRELAYLSHAVELVRAALPATRGESRVTVSVDRRIERRIRESACALIAERGRPRVPLLGVYPLERCIVHERGALRDMLNHEPHGPLRDLTGTQVTARQLFDRLYPPPSEVSRPGPSLVASGSRDGRAAR